MPVFVSRVYSFLSSDISSVQTLLQPRINHSPMPKAFHFMWLRVPKTKRIIYVAEYENIVMEKKHCGFHCLGLGLAL